MALLIGTSGWQYRHWRETFYPRFNNDLRACALRDAIVFARLARRVGQRPTRVPSARDVRLG